MEPLNGLDATFLYAETPRNQLHMTGVLVFDPSTMEGGYSFERMKAFVRERLPLSPAFTRKIVNVPFNISHPVWVDDPDFDVEAHLHRIGLPAPAGPAELAEVVGDIAGRPLDRNRPLWDMWFVEGLASGRIAVVAKMHHATIDGVSGANLMMHLFDLEPGATFGEEPAPAPAAGRLPSDWELLAYGLWARARRPLALPAAIGGVARYGWQLASRRLRPGAGRMAAPFSGPGTPFNAPVTPHRRVAFASVPLQDLRTVKDTFGTTVNDVVIAVVAGAVRRWLDKHGELPARPLVAGVPVSTRGEEEGAFGANLISAMFVSMATDVADPVERLLAIRQATQGAKDDFRAIGADAMRNWAEFSGPVLGQAVRLYSRMELAERHPPLCNLIVSNVPGPPVPLYFAGGRLESLFPLGPVFDGMGLNVTVLSYLDSVGFGFMACRELVPDLPLMAEAVSTSLAELTQRAEDGGGSPGRTRRARR